MQSQIIGLMDAIKINGQLRTDLSKQANNALRSNGMIPAVVYGGTETLHIAVSAREMRPLIYTPEFKKALIDINGTSYECIIQDSQFSVIDDECIHIDFLQLTEGKSVVVDIPVKFVGTSKGVRAGGKLIPRLRKLKVSALPSAMRPYLEVNVEDLDLGKHIRVRDINFDGINIVTAAANPIVSALVTRQLKQAEAEAKAKK